MTITVPLDQLQTTIASQFANVIPYIITSDGTAPPRITHVPIQFISPVIIKTRLGKTALATVRQNPNVSILYAHSTFSLIVDGVSDSVIDDGDEVIIRVQSAIRHQARH